MIRVSLFLTFSTLARFWLPHSSLFYLFNGPLPFWFRLAFSLTFLFCSRFLSPALQVAKKCLRAFPNILKFPLALHPLCLLLLVLSPFGWTSPLQPLQTWILSVALEALQNFLNFWNVVFLFPSFGPACFNSSRRSNDEKFGIHRMSVASNILWRIRTSMASHVYNVFLKKTKMDD